ncbi:MAG: symmetrical bis(5'-nucleosyl)-tetraphosphatase, partial [Campylobacterales bacterium]|nr:symmetrical bis(5'-nucleosyl)-tetraphosphatase [Campylobacterales bacterium]
SDNEAYAFSSFTRMRYCFPDGSLELENKSCPINDEILEKTKPWFKVENRKNVDKKIVFGHWSTLGFYKDDNVIALDTGCVWGGKLTAFNLDTEDIISVDCNNRG